MKTLILVDGSSYLYRAFHALPDLRTTKGEPTGAIRGVLAMLRKLLEDYKPDYFGVVFDAPGKTFRDDLYPQYKATRTAMPDDLRAQIASLHELVRANGWPLLIERGVEADDVIGTLVRRAEAQNIRSIVSTGDKDLAQLVSPNVTLINTMTNEKLDEAAVLAKFGVNPAQIVDYLTLIGDSIDNVPGVPKVGPKTAVKWLAEHGSLDNVIASADKIAGAVGENLRTALDWLPQGRRLLTVKCDVELDVAPDALITAAVDAAKLGALYERFEFRAWAKEITAGKGAPARSDLANTEVSQAGQAAGSQAALSFPAPVSRTYELIVDDADLERWLARIEAATLTSFNVEACGSDPMTATLTGLSFCCDPGVACYIPLAHAYAGAPQQQSRDAVLERLRSWFANPAAKKVGHNLKTDQHVLAVHGVRLDGVAHDTLLESYVLEAHKTHDIASLAARHLEVTTIPYADVCGKGAGLIAFDQVQVDRAAEFSAEDADVTLQLHHALSAQIAADPKLNFV
ncbi:MAG: 5'-3' exonuclease H3TH domain-containing protein, partial [Casimicrobiaceae bacterium]